MAGFIPPIPPIPPMPPIGGIPPNPPIGAPMPPIANGFPAAAPPKPALAYVPLEACVLDSSVLASVDDPPAPLPLTKCTVTPSTILYSSNVCSSLRIFPVKFGQLNMY